VLFRNHCTFDDRCALTALEFETDYGVREVSFERTGGLLRQRVADVYAA
jgi:hypothetical protein